MEISKQFLNAQLGKEHPNGIQQYRMQLSLNKEKYS